MTHISPLSFVNPSAKIGDNVTIEAFAFIDEDVVIGDNCHIRSHSSILRGTRMGCNNTVYEGCVIGAEPQDFRWHGERSFVLIGDNNKIREHVIINRSIHQDGATEIGNGSFVMAQTHIGHDSKIGNNVVLGNAVKVAGDCIIGDCTILSSSALLHEHCEVGRWVLVKGGCRINSHVPPYCIMAHNPVEYKGVNAFVMRRNNFNDTQINEAAQCFRHLYQSNTSVFNALKRIEADVAPSEIRDDIVSFVRGHNDKIVAHQMD